jgi:CHASE2 domain-containing sensor protein
VLALGLLGLALLTLRRRWEAIPIALLLAGISLIGGLLLAGVRRNLPVMPLVLALAGVTVVTAGAWLRARWFRARGIGEGTPHGRRTHRAQREAHPVPERGIR